MSLLSAQNLITPVLNRVHLFSIVTICVLFAIFRLSGGAVTTEPRREVAPRPASAVQKTETRMSPSKALEFLTPPAMPDESTKRALLEEVMPREAPTPVTARQEHDGLSEIEKSLGLK